MLLKQKIKLRHQLVVKQQLMMQLTVIFTASYFLYWFDEQQPSNLTHGIYTCWRLQAACITFLISFPSFLSKFCFRYLISKMREEEELIKSLDTVTSVNAGLLPVWWKALKTLSSAELLPFSHLLGTLYKVSEVLKRLCVTSQKEAFLTSHLSC